MFRSITLVFGAHNLYNETEKAASYGRPHGEHVVAALQLRAATQEELMKKPKVPKIFTEFKEFVTRGNVMGLAVGMIIGAAFTAIVTALVNSILKPLINAIPIGEGVSGLITMLVPRTPEGVEISMAAYNADPTLIDLSKSVYIDWGEFIMAIITFLLTALVLFLILKSVASLQKGFDAVKSEAEMLSSDEYAEMRKQGKSRKEIKEILARRLEEIRAAKQAEEAASAPETTEDLLREIRDLLKAQASPERKDDENIA